jgi:ubiquinone/menaquinone biosynthesis C-methylase UbiE
MTKRLRQSDEFAQTFDPDGQAVVYRFTHLERFIRISEMMRILLSCFPGDRAIEVRDALDKFARHCGVANGPKLAKATLAMIRRLIKLGVLIHESARKPGYDHRMAPYYVRSRSIPPQVCDEVIRAANVRTGSKVLDIGTGTGSLALYLAQVTEHVTGIDISQPFLEIARNVAGSRGLKVKFAIGSGNKLVFCDEKYNVAIMSQVFHWLDPICAARGMYQCLESDGTLIIIDQQAVLPAAHPLKRLAGYGYGNLSELQTAWIRNVSFYIGLFKLTTQCNYTIRLTGARCFHQRTCFDMSYARAFFLSDNLRALMPLEKHPWKTLERSLSQERHEHLEGDIYWLVLQFNHIRPDSNAPPYKFDIRDIFEIS